MCAVVAALLKSKPLFAPKKMLMLVSRVEATIFVPVQNSYFFRLPKCAGCTDGYVFDTQCAPTPQINATAHTTLRVNNSDILSTFRPTTSLPHQPTPESSIHTTQSSSGFPFLLVIVVSIVLLAVLCIAVVIKKKRTLVAQSDPIILNSNPLYDSKHKASFHANPLYEDLPATHAGIENEIYGVQRTVSVSPRYEHSSRYLAFQPSVLKNPGSEPNTWQECVDELYDDAAGLGLSAGQQSWQMNSFNHKMVVSKSIIDTFDAKDTAVSYFDPAKAALCGQDDQLYMNFEQSMPILLTDSMHLDSQQDGTMVNDQYIEPQVQIMQTHDDWPSLLHPTDEMHEDSSDEYVNIGDESEPEIL